MFLHLLSEPQKQALSVLARRLLTISGAANAQQGDRLADFNRRLALRSSATVNGEVQELDVSAFSSRQSQSIAMMELLAIVYADDVMDEAESNMIGDLALAFGFDQDNLNRMAEWVMSSLQLTRRGEVMMDG